MKQKMILLSAVLLLMLSLGMYGCQTSGNDAETGSGTSGGNEPVSVDGLGIVVNGKTDFSIVIADNADSAISEAAKSVQAALAKLADPVKDYVTDFDYRYGTAVPNENACVILIGQTCFPKSLNALNEAGYGDYILKVDGNSVIVTGWETASVQKGVSELVRMIKSHTDADGNVVFPDTYCELKEVNPAVNVLKLNDINGVRGGLTDCGNGCSRVIVNQVSEQSYINYTEALEQASYALYTSNEIDGFCYRTYTAGDYVLHLSYYSADRELRVLVESLKNTDLPGLESENIYTATVPSLAIPVSIELSDICDTKNGTGYNGMCYIYRLSDGSFIVYDGGWDVPEQGTRIYDLLRAYAPDPDHIVIAAWLITHAHADHMGGFINFANRFADGEKVTVERIICNRISGDFQSQTRLTSNVSKLTAAINVCHAKVTQAHPGQVFYLRNAKLEILYTLDLYDAEKLDEVNTSSVVSKLTIEGQSFLMLGDMSYSARVKMMSVYPDALKSDVVQLAHHGVVGGGSTDFYERVGAKYAFWPASTLMYEGGATATGIHKGGVKDAQQNSYFRNFVQGETLFVSGANNYVLVLPYLGSGATVIPAFAPAAA